MKDKLTHEVEILGRSVSVLLITGLLLTAGASAALLSSFGTVTGDANVDQSITVNSEDANEESFEQDWSFSGVVAGESVTDVNTIQNNLGTEQEVYFDGQVSNTPGDSDDEYVDSGDAYMAEHLLIENGVTFAEAPGEGIAEVEYALHDDQPAVRAYAEEQGEDGEISAGVWFDVDGTLEEGETEVTVKGKEGNKHSQTNPDWVYLVIEVTEEDSELDEGHYMLIDATVSEDTVTWEGQKFEGNDAALLKITNYDSAKQKEDYEFAREDDEDGNAERYEYDSDDVEGAKIYHAGTATGTENDGDDQVFEVFYTDFKLDGESLMTPVNFAEDEEVTVPSGDSEFGTVIDFKLAAYPGDYGFDLGVHPKE